MEGNGECEHSIHKFQILADDILLFFRTRPYKQIGYHPVLIAGMIREKSQAYRSSKVIATEKNVQSAITGLLEPRKFLTEMETEKGDCFYKITDFGLKNDFIH